jgi:hypothetical protein
VDEISELVLDHTEGPRRLGRSYLRLQRNKTIVLDDVTSRVVRYCKREEPSLLVSQTVDVEDVPYRKLLLSAHDWLLHTRIHKVCRTLGKRWHFILLYVMVYILFFFFFLLLLRLYFF